MCAQCRFGPKRVQDPCRHRPGPQVRRCAKCQRNLASFASWLLLAQRLSLANRRSGPTIGPARSARVVCHCLSVCLGACLPGGSAADAWSHCLLRDHRCDARAGCDTVFYRSAQYILKYTVGIPTIYYCLGSIKKEQAVAQRTEVNFLQKCCSDYQNYNTGSSSRHTAVRVRVGLPYYPIVCLLILRRY